MIVNPWAEAHGGTLKRNAALHKLEGGQSCPQPAFSRLWPPKKAAAAKIGRPPIYAECSVPKRES
jgi:hypothetical protein